MAGSAPSAGQAPGIGSRSSALRFASSIACVVMEPERLNLAFFVRGNDQRTYARRHSARLTRMVSDKAQDLLSEIVAASPSAHIGQDIDPRTTTGVVGVVALSVGAHFSVAEHGGPSDKFFRMQLNFLDAVSRRHEQQRDAMREDGVAVYYARKRTMHKTSEHNVLMGSHQRDAFAMFPVGMAATFAEVQEFGQNALSQGGHNYMFAPIPAKHVQALVDKDVFIGRSHDGEQADAGEGPFKLRDVFERFNADFPKAVVIVPMSVGIAIGKGALRSIGIPLSCVPTAMLQHFGLPKTFRDPDAVVPLPRGILHGDAPGACEAVCDMVRECWQQLRQGNPFKCEQQLASAIKVVDRAAEWARVKDAMRASGCKSYRFRFVTLLQFLGLACHVRAETQVRGVLIRSAKLVFGDGAEHIVKEIENLPVPDARVMRYMKLKFECCAAAWRREKIRRQRKAIGDSEDVLRTISGLARFVLSDSSPSAGVEALMTVFAARMCDPPQPGFRGAPGAAVVPDAAQPEEALAEDEFEVQVPEANEDSDDIRGVVEEDGRDTHIEFDIWKGVPAGLGNMSAPDKAVALVHQMAVDGGSSAPEILQYGREVFGLTHDCGVEDLLGDCPITAVGDWCREQGVEPPEEVSKEAVARYLERPETAHKAFLFPHALSIRGLEHAAHNTSEKVCEYLFGTKRASKDKWLRGTRSGPSGGDSRRAPRRRMDDAEENTGEVEVDVQNGIRAAGRVFGLRFMRARVLATIFSAVPKDQLPEPNKRVAPGEKRLRYPARTITTWRWGDVVQVILPVLMLRDVIERYWIGHVQEVLYADETVGEEELGEEAVDEEDEKEASEMRSNKTFRVADKAFTSQYFWGVVEVTALVMSFIEDARKWFASCSCHSEEVSDVPWHRRSKNEQQGADCPWKSRRALELSLGRLRELMEVLRGCIYRHMEAFLSTQTRLSAAMRSKLGNLLTGALGIAEAQLTMRANQFMKLPHAIVRMACPIVAHARRHAQVLRAAYEGNREVLQWSRVCFMVLDLRSPIGRQVAAFVEGEDMTATVQRLLKAYCSVWTAEAAAERLHKELKDEKHRAKSSTLLNCFFRCRTPDFLELLEDKGFLRAIPRLWAQGRNVLRGLAFDTAKLKDTTSRLLRLEGASIYSKKSDTATGFAEARVMSELAQERHLPKVHNKDKFKVVCLKEFFHRRCRAMDVLTIRTTGGCTLPLRKSLSEALGSISLKDSFGSLDCEALEDHVAVLAELQDVEELEDQAAAPGGSTIVLSV